MTISPVVEQNSTATSILTPIKRLAGKEKYYRYLFSEKYIATKKLSDVYSYYISATNISDGSNVAGKTMGTTFEITDQNIYQLQYISGQFAQTEALANSLASTSLALQNSLTSLVAPLLATEKIIQGLEAVSSSFLNMGRAIASTIPVPSFEYIQELLNPFAENILAPVNEITRSITGLTEAFGRFAEAVTLIYTELTNLALQSYGIDIDEYLGSGLEKDFRSLVRRNPTLYISGLERLIADDPIFETRIANLISSLGRMEDPFSHENRRTFVEARLSSGDTFIRDSAGSALAIMNDKKSIPALAEAISKEKYKGLQEDLKAVLRQIEMRGDGPISAHVG